MHCGESATSAGHLETATSAVHSRPVVERHQSGLGWVCSPHSNGRDKRAAKARPLVAARNPWSWAHLSFLQQGRAVQVEVGCRQPFRLAAGGGPDGAKHHGLDLTFDGSIGPAVDHTRTQQIRECRGFSLVPGRRKEKIFTVLPPRLTWALRRMYTADHGSGKCPLSAGLSPSAHCLRPGPFSLGLSWRGKGSLLFMNS
jgi:hypothetical protein